jgi:hypothetical protein
MTLIRENYVQRLYLLMMDEAWMIQTFPEHVILAFQTPDLSNFQACLAHFNGGLWACLRIHLINAESGLLCAVMARFPLAANQW